MIAKDRWTVAGVILLGVALFSLASLTLVVPYREFAPWPDQVCNNIALDRNVSGNFPKGKTGCPPPPEGASAQSVREQASQNVLGTFGLGTVIFAVLAGVSGAVAVSAETQANTIYTLLSRPVSRSRILLTKYLVRAASLLAAALIGTFVLAALMWWRGYPMDGSSVFGLVLSALLAWLGALFVLGGAVLFSVVFRNVVASIVAASVVLAGVLTAGYWLDIILYTLFSRNGTPERWYNLLDKLSLINYWTSDGLVLGRSFATTDFLVCLVAAAIPLFVSLWVFSRRSF